MEKNYGDFSEAYLARLLDEETKICAECLKLFPNDLELDNHVSEKHIKSNEDKQAAAAAKLIKKLIECPLCKEEKKCSKKFSKLEELKSHYNAIHHFSAYGHCNICSQPFRSKAELDLHECKCKCKCATIRLLLAQLVLKL